MFGFFENNRGRAAALLQKHGYGYLICFLPEYVGSRDLNDIISILEDSTLNYRTYTYRHVFKRGEVLEAFLKNL